MPTVSLPDGTEIEFPDGMSAGEITKRFNTEGYTTPPKKELTRRPGETLTSFNMRKQRALNAERKADFLSKR